MALDTIDLHGIILAPVTGTPAVGTVTFKILDELRDDADNTIYAPQTFTATLDVNGEFTIELPVTDQASVTPLNWSYWVYVNTDIWTSGVFYIQLPAALGPVAEFADLLPVDLDPNSCTPDGSPCAPIGIVGTVTELQAEVDELAEVLGSLEITVEGLENDVDLLQSDVATLQVTQGALVNTVNILTPAVTTLQNQMTAVLANPGLINPTAFQSLTNLHANVTQGSTPAASRYDRGMDNTRFRGFVQATVLVAAGQIIGRTLNPPLHPINMGIRFSGGSTRLLISTLGDITLGSNLPLGEQLWFDGVTFDLLP